MALSPVRILWYLDLKHLYYLSFVIGCYSGIYFQNMEGKKPVSTLMNQLMDDGAALHFASLQSKKGEQTLTELGIFDLISSMFIENPFVMNVLLHFLVSPIKYQFYLTIQCRKEYLLWEPLSINHNWINVFILQKPLIVVGKLLSYFNRRKPFCWVTGFVRLSSLFRENVRKSICDSSFVRYWFPGREISITEDS